MMIGKLILKLAFVIVLVTVTEAIIKGKNAEKNEFPWLVRFNASTDTGGSQHCSGTLIDLDLVLTTASCVVDHNGMLAILAGDHLLFENDGTEQIGRSLQVFVHEDFNTTGKHNDIAIIRLESKFPESTAIRPLRLPPADLLPEYVEGGSGIAAGWGETEVSVEVGALSPVLQKTGVLVGDRFICKALAAELPEGQICTMGSPGGYRGDIGGPLICYNETNGVCGILSTAMYGAANSLYGGYVEVSKYLEWIAEQKNRPIEPTTESPTTLDGGTSTGPDVSSTPVEDSTATGSISGSSIILTVLILNLYHFLMN